MKRYWELPVRFLVVADDDTSAWAELYRQLPETGDIIVQYDSIKAAEEWIPDWISQSSASLPTEGEK